MATGWMLSADTVADSEGGLPGFLEKTFDNLEACHRYRGSNVEQSQRMLNYLIGQGKKLRHQARLYPSNPTHKNQYEQYHDYESQPAARIITPVLAMRPRGQRAHEN